jgi:hypothetical protein
MAALTEYTLFEETTRVYIRGKLEKRIVYKYYMLCKSSEASKKR